MLYLLQKELDRNRKSACRCLIQQEACMLEFPECLEDKEAVFSHSSEDFTPE